jgi:hypothetical protein
MELGHLGNSNKSNSQWPVAKEFGVKIWSLIAILMLLFLKLISKIPNGVIDEPLTKSHSKCLPWKTCKLHMLYISSEMYHYIIILNIWGLPLIYKMKNQLPSLSQNIFCIRHRAQFYLKLSSINHKLEDFLES